MAQVVVRSSKLLSGGARLILRQLHSGGAAYKIFDIKKEDEFSKKVLSADKPVIVDFHAKLVAS